MDNTFTPRDLAEFQMDRNDEPEARTFYHDGMITEVREDGTIYRYPAGKQTGPAWTEEDLLDPFAE